jgi:TP901 family phage tail tape measure protein
MIGAGASKITVEIGGKVLGSLGASLRGAQAQVSSFGRNINRTMRDASRSFKNVLRDDAFQLATVGAAGIGVALTASVKAAASFESVLSEIGKTANVGNAELKILGNQITGLSARNRTNLGPEKLAAGVQDLVAQGLSLQDAVASMEALGRVATATNSDLLDVTKTGFQLQNALKIRPTELNATFDALAFAGKQGAFELKDMAQFMPTIAAAAGSLGIQGKQGAISLAAMMQMVRKDAPDAGQAATRLTDAMLKMTAPDAVKRFKKFGVNIEQVMQNAKAKGINPMEAALDELQRVTGGDVFKLGQIFGDKEAKLGLMSLMKYRKEYEQLKADAGGAGAAGTIDRDYQKSIATFAGTMTSFQNSAQRLGIALGNALLPSLTMLAEAITPLVESFANFAQTNPAFTSFMVGISAAFAGLVPLIPVIASAVSVFSSLSAAIGGAGGIGAVLAGIGTFITGPIGITIAAIVGIGAALVWAYTQFEWFRNATNAVFKVIGDAITGIIAGYMQVFQGIGQMFSGVWDLVVGVFTGNTKLIDSALDMIQVGFMNVIGGIFNGYKAAYGWLFVMTMDFAKRLPGMVLSAIVNLPTTVGNVLRGLHHLNLEISQRITAGIKWTFDQLVAQLQQTPARLASVGQAIIDAIINGLKGRAPALFGWVSGAWDRIKGLVGQGGGGGGGAAPTPPGRATGGGVSAGMPYIVGERRRELFVPGMDGAIVPRVARPVTAAALASLLAAPMPAAAAPSAAPVVINAPVTINAAGGNPQEIRRQVELAFVDIQRQAESSHRVLLND